MTRTYSKLFAAGLISAVAGFSSGPFSTSTQAAGGAWGSIQKDGAAGGAIHVTSEDNQSWTKIQPSPLSFPVGFSAHAQEINPLNRVWVVQGNPMDVTHHDLYDTNDVGTGLQSVTFHSDTKILSGGTLYLSNGERNQIIAGCNAKLKPFANQQPQHQTDIQIPLTLVMQVTSDGVGWSDGPWSTGVTLSEDWESVNFTVPVICDGFTRETPAVPDQVATPDNESRITKVELALSANGAMANGTLEYTGTCPMGITLNMGWFTNLSTPLKSYIKHKDLAGQANWTSETFTVTTNQLAQGGLWKKEMTDLISIPFAGAVAVNGPGGANVHNLPNGGYQFNPGSGGGFNPATSLGASNSGTSNGLTQYIGFFQLVAYKKKTIVPVLLIGGGMSNTTIYEGQKMSGWRKYIVTCEPQQNTSIPQGPTGVFNPGQQDTHQIDTAGGLVTTHPATNTPRIPVVPGVVTTGQNNKAADIVRKRDEDARRKAIAAALARRKAALKRSTVAPVRTMRIRRR